jgi:hypothetical protein
MRRRPVGSPRAWDAIISSRSPSPRGRFRDPDRRSPGSSKLNAAPARASISAARAVSSTAPNSQSDKLRYIRTLLPRRIDENRRVDASRWNRFVFLDLQSRCAMVLHGNEQRQVSIQRQSSESTDRSPLVSVARSGQWRDPGQQKAGLSRQSTKAGQRDDGLSFE